MTIKVQLKRSAVKDKQPLPADLEYGELAVNYNKDSVRLYTKASDNTVAEVGGKPADASTTAKGIIQLATAAEVLAGTDLVKAVTPKEAKDHYLAKNIALLSALP
jgi:hypothetical protein